MKDYAKLNIMFWLFKMTSFISIVSFDSNIEKIDYQIFNKNIDNHLIIRRLFYVFVNKTAFCKNMTI